jgi:hypothetical protein
VFQDSESIATRNKWCEWRDFFAENPIGNAASSWIQLEKGQFYPIQADLREYSGTDHLSVAVEFKTTDTEGHHHAAREIQLLEMVNNGTPEEWELIIEQEA